MIGPVVRQLRQERKLSQETLAALAQVSSGYLSKLERGLYKQPSYEVLDRLAAALAVSTPDLYQRAGMSHLLLEADPTWASVLETFTPRLDGLPKRDHQIIMGELRRIFREETESKA